MRKAVVHESVQERASPINFSFFTLLEYKVEYWTFQRYLGWKKTLEISYTFKM